QDQKKASSARAEQLTPNRPGLAGTGVHVVNAVAGDSLIETPLQNPALVENFAELGDGVAGEQGVATAIHQIAHLAQGRAVSCYLLNLPAGHFGRRTPNA